MDNFFSEYQRELHLPNQNNPDLTSPENCIISKFTPSIYKYAWFSRHFIELLPEVPEFLNSPRNLFEHDKQGENIFFIPRKFFGLVNLKIKGDNVSLVELSFGESKGNGDTRDYDVKQYFDFKLINYFGLDNLPWFFNYDRNFIYMAEVPDDRCLRLRIVGDNVKCVAEYRDTTNSEKFHWTRNPSRKINYARVWIKLEDLRLGEYDSTLSILIFGELENNVLLKQGNVILANCDPIFLQESKNVYRYDNYDEGDQVFPGIPSHEKITFEGKGHDPDVYVQICKIIKF